jgi:hypothetical protein
VSCHAHGVIGKLSMNKGVSTYNAKVIENHFSLKIHLNNGIWAHSWYC